MRIITKLDSSCVGLSTFPAANRVYAASELGTITTIKEEEVGAKYRNPDGCRSLQVTRGGTRVIYLDNSRRTLCWRDIRPSGLSSQLGHLNFHSPDTLLTSGLNSRIMAAAIVQDVGYSLLRFGNPGRKSNQLEIREHVPIVGDPVVHSVCMFGGPITLDDNDTFDSFLAVSWRQFVTLSQISFGGRHTVLGELTIGTDLRIAVRTLNNVLYGATADGRLMRLRVDQANPHNILAPDFVTVPGTPLITCMDLSPCGRYVAVGANYNDEFGGVLLYDADLKPIAMYDTTCEPNAVLFKSDSTLANSPSEVDNSNALTLYSGHDNGQIIRWYIARQLEWLSLIESRAPSERRGSLSTTRRDEVVHERALDL